LPFPMRLWHVGHYESLLVIVRSKIGCPGV
jgi:hypothetical protein